MTSIYRVLGVALVGVLAGCGSDLGDRQVSATATDDVRQLMHDGYTTFAATDRYLVAFAAPDLESADSTPRAIAVPLEGGEAQRLDIAPKDPTKAFTPTAWATTGDAAVLFGRECPGETDGSDPDAAQCSQGTLAALRIDPESGTAKPVPIDERARELAGLTVSSVQRRSNGWYVFASRLDRPPSGPDDIVGRHTTVLVGDPDGIDLAVDWQGQGDTCVADGRVYQLTRQLPEGEPAIPLDADAVVSLHTLPLSGGPEVPVKLPPVSTAFGGQNVTLGCDPSGPFLATAQGDPTAPQTAVYQLVNDAWTERTDLVPRDAVRPEPPISDYRGVLIPWQVGKMELERESTAVVDDTDAAFVRNDVAPGQFWRGSTGDRITVVRPSEADPGQSGLLMTEFWS